MTPVAVGMSLDFLRIEFPMVLPETERLVEIGARVGLTVLVAFLFQRLLFLVIGRAEKLLVRAGHGPRGEQRAHTLGQIFRNLATVLIGAGALIHVLELFGWNVAPLLASVGIVGVALGFGAQTLVRDIIAGVFILAENQFSVGDLIEVNGKPATVEAVTVRCTVLRDFNGSVYFVPNGEMKIVVNRSRDWSRTVVDVGVPADQDLDVAIEVCRKVAEQLNAEPGWRSRVLDPAEVWGVEFLGTLEARIRIVVRTTPGADGPEITRELRRRVHRALAKAGIRSALPRDLTPAPVESPAADVPQDSR